MKSGWYYYLHTNGDLIGKSPVAVDSIGAGEYFDSDFVKKWWYIDTTERGDAWRLVLEAVALGADMGRIRPLAVKWNLTKDDLKEFIVRNPKPTDLQKDGMDKFIREILGAEPDAFWDQLLKEGAPK